VPAADDAHPLRLRAGEDLDHGSRHDAEEGVDPRRHELLCCNASAVDLCHGLVPPGFWEV
jgi:hypothetical protein